jgi:hypothetical protein
VQIPKCRSIRHEPTRFSAEHGGPNTDRYHGEEVIHSADWMHEAVEEARSGFVTGMGEEESSGGGCVHGFFRLDLSKQ